MKKSKPTAATKALAAFDLFAMDRKAAKRRSNKTKKTAKRKKA